MSTTTEVQTAPVLNGVGTTEDSKHHDVTVDINYLAIPNDGTELTLHDLAQKTPKFTDIRKVTMRDVRGFENTFDLDKNGFEYAQHTTPLIDFLNEEEVKKRHYPLMEQFLKDQCGASKVKIFNHIVRNAPALRTGENAGAGYKGPAQRPHVDSAPSYIQEMLENSFGAEEAASFVSGRHAIINMWRPLKTVQKDPLAVCDSFTVPEEDYHMFTYKKDTFEHTKGEGKRGAEVYFTKAGKGEHKWYYLHGQTPKEVLLFKIFDSADGVAQRVTHSSFEDPETVDQPTRESIEIRAVACW